MEMKSESTRSSSGSSEGTWWRWSHGKNGSVTSSFSAHHGQACSTSSASAAATQNDGSWQPCWQGRPVRTRAALKDDKNRNGLRPHFESSPLGPAISQDKVFMTTTSSASNPRTTTTRNLTPRRRVDLMRRETGSARKRSTRSVPAELKLSAQNQEQFTSRLTWSVGSSKQKIVRKDKKPSKVSSLGSSSTAHGCKSVKPRQAFGAHSNIEVSSPPSPPLWLDASRTSRIDLSEDKSSHLVNNQLASNGEVMYGATNIVDSSPPRASLSPSSRTRPHPKPADPLVDCARAVLQDCIRQRHLETNAIRKRTLDGVMKGETNSKVKASDTSPFSCGSSSSDDELSQLSALEAPWNCGKDSSGVEYKLHLEELQRQQLLHHSDHSSSPDIDRLSPFLEEKGLPVEIRYQLPIALGTANETDKECPICQLRYGIGDHIVTLPCEHFFHACCVDKWLWSHTSCPLCRTEVSLERLLGSGGITHQFTECSEVDQEDIRRKMRTQSTGFRPVKPAELDLVESQLSSMAIHDNQNIEQSQFQYLVCPKPQRPYSK